MKQAGREVGYQVLKVSSSAFEDNGYIPVKYTCDGDNVNPPLHIDAVPPTAKSLAIIVDDPDAPVGTWVHWLIWNVPVLPHIKEQFRRGLQGMNDFGRKAYGGPCPPPGKPHRYFFRVFALDDLLDLPDGIKKELLERAMERHIVAFGKLVGLYKRA